MLDLGHDPECTCTACAELVLRHGAHARAARALGVLPRPVAKAEPRSDPRGPSLWRRALASRERVRLKKSLESVIAHLAGYSPVAASPRPNLSVLAYLRRELEKLEEREPS